MADNYSIYINLLETENQVPNMLKTFITSNIEENSKK